MREPNYFLYIVGTEGKAEHLSVGNCGVGRTSIGPGIYDAPYGTMYIITAEEFYKRTKLRKPQKDTIRRTILRFYGVDWL